MCLLMTAQSITLYISYSSWVSLTWPQANTAITKATSHLLPVTYSPSSSHASTTICKTTWKTQSGDLSAWIIMENEWEGFSSDSDSWSGMFLGIKIKEERLFSGSIGLSTPKLSPQRSGKFYAIEIKTSFCLHKKPTKWMTKEIQPLNVSVANITPPTSRYKSNYCEKFRRGGKEKPAHRSFHSNAC